MTAVLIVFVLMLLNGVFAGAEIAVLSVRKTRLAELGDEGRAGARAVLWLRHQPERFLATVQIGLTLVGTTAAAFGGERLAHDLAARLASVPGVGAWAPRIALVTVILSISFLEIVLGELVPKSLALRSAERYALLSGPLLRRMATVVKPVVWLLTASSNLVLRAFGDRTSFSEARLSPEEIQELLEEAGRVGAIDAKTTEIASRALDFRGLHASDVLVPRASIVALPVDATPARWREVLARHPHTRVPVYDGSPENYVGYATAREVLLALAASPDAKLAGLVRPVRFVPETVRALDLLRMLQSEGTPVAMVVDETGAVTGIVTIEDLLEELVGDILSENDKAAPKIALGPDGTAVIPAETALRDVDRALDIELPEPEGFTTLGGLCLHLAGNIPTAGTTLEAGDGTTLEVLEASPRKVRLVRVRPAPRRDATVESDET